jgi:hypothetical protein
MPPKSEPPEITANYRVIGDEVPQHQPAIRWGNLWTFVSAFGALLVLQAVMSAVLRPVITPVVNFLFGLLGY